MKNSSFKTHDFGLAVSLVTKGYPVTSLDKSNPERVEFLFEQCDGLNEAVQAYWSASLQVNALGFFQNSKLLKNRLYSE